METIRDAWHPVWLFLSTPVVGRICPYGHFFRSKAYDLTKKRPYGIPGG